MQRRSHTTASCFATFLLPHVLSVADAEERRRITRVCRLAWNIALLGSGHESAPCVRLVRTPRERASTVYGPPAMADLAGQGVNTAVRDDGDVATAVHRSVEHLLDGAYDPALCVNGLFPAADILVGMSKEQVRHGFASFGGHGELAVA